MSAIRFGSALRRAPRQRATFSSIRYLATVTETPKFDFNKPPKNEDAFVLKGKKEVVFEKRETDHYFRNLKPNEVVVAPRATGICGSVSPAESPAVSLWRDIGADNPNA